MSRAHTAKGAAKLAGIKTNTAVATGKCISQSMPARARVCVCARAYIRVTLCLFIVARWEGSAITGVKVENLVGLK